MTTQGETRASARDAAQRIVVTGMGVITSLGETVPEFWDGLVEGRSGIRRITLCNTEGYPCKVAGEITEFDPRRYMDHKDARRVSRATQFAVAAARCALADAGLADADLPEEAGVLLGTGNSSFPDLEAAARTLLAKGGMKISPFAMPAVLPNMSASAVAMTFGLRGYNSTVSTACAAGTQALGEAIEVLRRGDAEVLLAGGTEAPICELGLAGFCVLRALSTRFNDDPARASRPFDARRDGFVSGEGGAVLVLETLERARARGARVYAELLGYGATSDAYHITAPDPEARGAAQAMQRALRRAGVAPGEVDYINAHGTATPQNDPFETAAIKRVFGGDAWRIPVSSNKSMIGHCLGAAGAIEAVATICALRDGVIPPTINYEEPDPLCDLDYVPNEARRAPLRIAMSNSFGFGGQNASLVIGRYDDATEDGAAAAP
ncbi:MAG TPA: beta-ketoacyl-ACP synthase II [Thermomicrobiales bacterium]|nr:beta-ketoacyl-ACP synthase II [Thermomicrobiales bacterium]